METILNRIANLFEQKVSNCKSKNSNRGSFRFLYSIIKDAITTNSIPYDSVLPSTRKLAKEIIISRSTVIKSYELLIFEGYIEVMGGSGHKVKWKAKETWSSRPSLINGFKYPKLSETGESFQKNVSLLNTTDDKGISFRPGLPPLDIFPVNKWKSLSNLYWRHIKSSALSYSASSGMEQLKTTLANYLNFSRNIKCDPKQIIIVSGSVQSLFIIGNVVLNPGDNMFIENPTFPNVLSIFKGLRANIQEIGIDEQGIKLDEMEEHGHLNSKLIHTTPSSNYPTGVRMSLKRRLELLKWANNHNTLIIENDYEHEINNFHDFIPALFSLDREQRTIFLGTFNRLLHPSIRVGYMVVPLYLLNAVEAFLKHSHRFVPSSIQVVLSQFIEKKYLFNHIKNVIEIAEERKELFLNNFYDSFGESIILNKNQTRSLHILAELSEGKKDTEMAAYFAKNNIITHPYSKCFKSITKKQGLIFGYSPVRPPIIKRKINQMEKLYKQQF